MPCVLLVDDDPDQLELRRMIFEREGYRVLAAPGTREAVAAFDENGPSLVVLDLRLPKAEDGLALIRQIRERSNEARIVVLSGWLNDLSGRPERDMVQDVLPKPVKSAKLLARAAKLACFCFLLGMSRAWAADAVVIEVKEPREVIAELDLRSTGSAWNKVGREAAIAEIRLNGKMIANIPVFMGERTHRYSILLGRLEPGTHTLDYRRSARSPQGVSLASSGVRARQIATNDPNYEVVAHAPVLFARTDNQRFSDVPLAVYCETFTEGSRRTLQYSVIFSNEDGGTSTRALMARWGRATDIEMIYRVTLDENRKPVRAMIQTRDHREVDFNGEYEGFHPLLGVVTENNMVAPEGRSAIRWPLTPRRVVLADASREQVMDDAPWTYRIMAEELEREGKLREFGKVDGQKISDPRNYLYLEAKVTNADTRISAVVRLRNSSFWQAAHLGRFDYAIERSGWIRLAVELPPMTDARNIAEVGFVCFMENGTKERPVPPASACTLHSVRKMFQLTPDLVPGPNLWPEPLRQPATIPTGQMMTVLVHGN